jgi:hypothetical protein
MSIQTFSELLVCTRNVTTADASSKRYVISTVRSESCSTETIDGSAAPNKEQAKTHDSTEKRLRKQLDLMATFS